MNQHSDRWSAAEFYDEFMGRWSRQLAPKFLDWLGAPRTAHWLEVGCGTGALTSAICVAADPASVVACDPSPSFIDAARIHTRDSRVTCVVAGADDFPTRAGGYDSITSLLALNFFPDPGSAVRRMAVSLAPGGVASACVWDYAAGGHFLRYFWDAAVEVRAEAAELDEARRFPVCHPDQLRAVFEGAGLLAVACEPIEVATCFASFDDYWAPMLGGTGPAPAFVHSLDAVRQERLRQTLQSRLPAGIDGSIPLLARAWAVRGHRYTR